MPTLPYLPAGQSSLPAERYLLFADTSHRIHRIDESAVQKDGVSFTAYWESGALNGEEAGKIFTLEQLYLFYTARSVTTLVVKGSGDGGETWSVSDTVSLLATTERVRTAVAGLGVTGDDLRFRLEFTTDVLVNVFGYRPVLVDRGDLVF